MAEREVTAEEKQLVADMVARARKAMEEIAGYDQEQVDRLARALPPLALRLADDRHHVLFSFLHGLHRGAGPGRRRHHGSEQLWDVRRAGLSRL